jgi:DNA-directed RNA polymerase specialized sigma24 family protein
MRRSGGPIVTRSFAAIAARPTPRGAPAPIPTPPAASTSRPTTEFRQHHRVEAPQVDSTAFRQAWLRTTRLDGLLEAGRIDRDQHDAASRWRAWGEKTAPLRVQPWDVRVDRSVVPNDAVALARVQTAAKLRAVAEALGPLRVRLLTMCVLEDRSWREIGDRLGVDGKTAKDWCAASVIALAAFLAGEPVPEAPLLRFRNQPGSR